VCAPDQGSDRAVVVFSGSGGGVPEGYAQRLAEHGLTAFALGYFGTAGLPPSLVEIPLDAVADGIRWFRDRYAPGGPVGVMGSSKGAELVLLLASYFGDLIGPVVAVAPTHVTWYGLDFSDPSSARRSSWTFRGHALPFLPYRDDAVPTVSKLGTRIDVCYDVSRYEQHEVDATRIAVERAVGPILLLSGDDDHMWSSTTMCGEVVRRSAQHGRAGMVTHIAYPGAGHVFLHSEFLPAADDATGPRFDFGGTAAADRAAAADAWPRLTAFLRSGLCPT
jgi:dienelactone hydrolase